MNRDPAAQNTGKSIEKPASGKRYERHKDRLAEKSHKTKAVAPGGNPVDRLMM
eukprot:CAMPEP_0171518574 /NCGR_PEP_ID=MMETSP0959-20130129/5356_1 /TAXON_ID=87120 /ORGANISM="Aurantiochytrium limacinum, Strain ATCCMYA-1381" /LENGTH=52 /DNA_ID=CAMNT_0012057787 /DNA_START=632 /DNA_END=790 /DNA_ORIENTATION=-